MSAITHCNNGFYGVRYYWKMKGDSEGCFLVVVAVASQCCEQPSGVDA